MPGFAKCSLRALVSAFSGLFLSRSVLHHFSFYTFLVVALTSMPAAGFFLNQASPNLGDAAALSANFRLAYSRRSFKV